MATSNYRAEADLEIYQGASFAMTITCLDDNSEAMDLTDYQVYMEIRTRPAGKLLLHLDSSTGAIVLDPLIGEIDIGIDYEDTDALPAGTWRYDVFLVSPNDETRTCIAFGDVVVYPKTTVIVATPPSP